METNYSSTCYISHHFDHQFDKHLFPILYCILIIVSIPANSASLWISCCQVKRKNELGIYLFSLSLADLFYTMTLPLWIYYAQNEDNWILPSKLCSLSVFFQYLNYYTSSAFLTCISIDRYLAVVYPLKFHYLRTRRFALIVSLFVWAFEIMSNSQILIHKEIFEENDVGQNHTNRSLCYDTYPLHLWQASLNIYRFSVGYVIPLAIMVFCYYKIYHAVKCNQATQENDKKKINHLLLSIIITFFICFTPYHIVLLIRSIIEPCNSNAAKRMFVPYRLATALTSLNCIADPILYCFVSETGRMDVWNVLRCGSSARETGERPSQTLPSSVAHKAEL